ncbi:MAG: hypothetical protein VX199_02120 [Chloroflexota bacterium]|nr:hypothetical protein [Chloroflexota bacterium]
MKRKRYGLFGLITIVGSLLLIELLTRGAFAVFGKYDSWGYPKYIYQYRPYIGYGYVPFEDGRDRYGYTLDSNDDQQRDLSSKDKCEFRIFMLGGSTVLGRYLDSEDGTLPARLELILNKGAPTGIKYQVINAGKPAYFSIQNLLEHAFYIRYSLQPDYIVHFQGSNDSVGHPKYWPHQDFAGLEANIGAYHEEFFTKGNATDNLKGSLNAVFRNLSDYSAFVFALHKTVNDPNVWIRYIRDVDVVRSDKDVAADQNNEQVGMMNWVDKHVNRFIYNVRLATMIADKNVGVAYLLQPTMLLYMKPWLTEREKDFLAPENYTTEFHGYPKADSKQFYYFKVRKEFEDLKAQNESDYVVIEDMSKLFDGKPRDEAYFGDYVHYLPRGRDVIAPEIVKIIGHSIDDQIKISLRLRECL